MYHQFLIGVGAPLTAQNNTFFLLQGWEHRTQLAYGCTKLLILLSVQIDLCSHLKLGVGLNGSFDEESRRSVICGGLDKSPSLTPLTDSTYTITTSGGSNRSKPLPSHSALN